MKLKNIVYLDSSIKVCFVKTGREELTELSPDLVQYLIISYGIGLINNPGTQVKETIKIDRIDIYTNGIHEHLTPSILGLISIIMPKKSLKINKKYLQSENWTIKNTAFEQIQKMHSESNLLWYNNEER